MKRLPLRLAGIALIAGIMLTGCGNGISADSGANNEPGQENPGGNSGNDVENESGSNIPYLRQNHTNYTELGSNMTPSPVKDPNALSLNWTIEGDTEQDAMKLADHIGFMVSRLESGGNPRAWDKLFLMEAYMKVNHYYTTSVERNGNVVVVSKNATNQCAYAVISAHSDAVSGDFFARGDIMQDYSSRAEAILQSSFCDTLRSDIQSYIDQRQRSRRGRGR